MSKMYGYIVVTHGRREISETHPGVVRQLANLEDAAALRGRRLVWRYDYAREVRGAASLPELFACLELFRQHDSHLVMDDVSRLFRACHDEPARQLLASELEPYSANLFGLRQGGTLTNLNAGKLALVCSGQMKADFQLPNARKRTRQVEDGSEQTSAANSASGSARQAMSRRKAAELSDVRAELREAGLPMTLAAIAAAANERGLTTNRARSWRADTVGRLLRKLDKEADYNRSQQAG